MKERWEKIVNAVEKDKGLPDTTTYLLTSDVANMLKNDINPKSFFNKNILTKATKKTWERKSLTN